MRDLYRAIYSALFVCGNFRKDTLGHLQTRIRRPNKLVYGQKRVIVFIRYQRRHNLPPEAERKGGQVNGFVMHQLP